MKTVSGLLVMLLAGATMAFAQQQVVVSVDGTPVHFTDVNPIKINDRVMVPLRGVFEKMGADVHWDENTKSASAWDGKRHIVLKVGEPYAMVDDKEVSLDSPAILVRDRVLVPLRFVSESFGATVNWNEDLQVASILTPSAEAATAVTPTMATINPGTVIPFKLNGPLSSDMSKVGDKFTAAINTGAEASYLGLPTGTVIEGHVDTARAKTNEAPGVLGLTFDHILLPDGMIFNVDGSLIGTDEKSVDNLNGRLTAKDTAAKKDLKFVGYGAGAGALVSIITKGNFLTDTLIGAALGYFVGQGQQDTSKYNDVMLKPDYEFGVMLNKELSFAVPK